MCFCIIVKGIKYILELAKRSFIGRLLFDTTINQPCYGVKELHFVNSTLFKGCEEPAHATLTDKGMQWNGHLFAVVGIIRL